MSSKLMRIIALLLVAMNSQAQTLIKTERDKRYDYSSLLREIAMEIQAETAFSQHFIAEKFSFDTAGNHYPAIVFCNNDKLLPQAEDLYRRPIKKVTYPYHPSGDDLYLEIRIFPPSSEMMMQYEYGKDHLLPDSAGIFLEIIAEENKETAKLKQLVWQTIQGVKERVYFTKLQEEILTSENFELLRTYIIEKGIEMSEWGVHPVYQVVFEDTKHNIRYQTSQSRKLVNKKVTDFFTITVSEISVEKSNFPAYQLSHAHGQIYLTVSDDGQFGKSAYLIALEDFIKRITSIKNGQTPD